MPSKKATAASNGTATSNSQTTPLTPNSNCTAVGSGDTNNSTTVQFYSPQNGIVWWTAAVSSALKTAVLSGDIGNAVVTFKQGLTVTYAATGTGGAYNVFLSGNIVDNGSLYTFAGSVVYMSTGAASGTVSVKLA
ncbi:MAG TPA: hypothetical protein VF656_11500 [Pyrinomonadaceae bacterium]|jgi:hypothetical protein